MRFLSSSIELGFGLILFSIVYLRGGLLKYTQQHAQFETPWLLLNNSCESHQQNRMPKIGQEKLPDKRKELEQIQWAPFSDCIWSVVYYI